MSSPIIIPFDNNPVSISVKTASYTVPVGKYARVVVNLEGASTFTINGVLALRGTTNSVLGSSIVDTNNLLNSGGSIMGQGFMTSSGTVGTSAGAAFASATDAKTVVYDVWVPSGTVLSGTLIFRLVVTEYNRIS